MDQEKHGLQVFDEKGQPILQVGPHVVGESPEFAKKIGMIAASWAQAEVNLNCLFAVLLNTTPEESANELRKHSTAAKATCAARKIAADTLSGSELDSLNGILDQLDRARSRRNRVQHDVWARKAGDSHRIYAVHSNEYFSLATKFLAMGESKGGVEVGRAIEIAMAFADNVSNGYSLEDLESIAEAINSVSKLLLEAMFHRLRLRLAEK